MFVGRIEARAYSRSTEIEERVVSAVLNLFPEKLRDEIPITATRTEGQSGDSILVIESLVDKKKTCEEILDHIMKEFSSASRQEVLHTLEQRLDDDCTLFLRIDKQGAYLGRIETPSGPDVVSLRVHLRDYPRCEREKAIEMLERLLQREED